MVERGIAVVNGGAGGIGLAVVMKLAGIGYQPIILDVNEAACRETVAQLAETGVKGEYHTFDLTRKDDVQNAMRDILAKYGGIAALVNLAGGTLYAHPIQEFPLDEWQRVIDVNLKATFLCCQAAIPTMKAQRKGAIVNTTSNFALTGDATRTAYAASKAAVVSFTKSLAVELAPFNVRANCIGPGRTATARVMQNFTPERWAGLTDIPMGRAAEPEEIAEGVAFLVSDDSAFMTGQSLHVNGGMVRT